VVKAIHIFPPILIEAASLVKQKLNTRLILHPQFITLLPGAVPASTGDICWHEYPPFVKYLCPEPLTTCPPDIWALLQAASNVSSSHNALVNLFEI
jgi:hypothetical protein